MTRTEEADVLLTSRLEKLTFEGPATVFLIVEKPSPGVHIVTATAFVEAGSGLVGDHDRKDFYRGERIPGREVTAIASEFCAEAGIDPSTVGDNLVTRGIDLRALKPGDRVAVGPDVVLERSEPVHRPCLLFRERAGESAYRVALEHNWRGALFTVIKGGAIEVGSEISPVHRHTHH